MSISPLAITPDMVELLRWCALPDREKKRRWKTRPKVNKARKMALIRRGLVKELPTGTLEVMLGDVTPKGREMLKVVAKSPPKAPPKKSRRERVAQAFADAG